MTSKHEISPGVFITVTTAYSGERLTATMKGFHDAEGKAIPAGNLNTTFSKQIGDALSIAYNRAAREGKPKLTDNPV